MNTKHFLLLMMLVVVQFTARAQQGSSFDFRAEHDENHEHHGLFFAGGALTFWNDTKEKKLTLDFCPEVGFLINDDFGVGLLLGYEYESESDRGVAKKHHAFKVSPFLRYYYYHKEPFNLFLDAGFGVNWANGADLDNFHGGYVEGFEVGFRPGACVDLTEGLCLCLRFGFVGYRNDYFMGEEPGLTPNGFGIRFAPEELMIGLELEF